MAKARERKIKITKGEVLLYGCGILSIAFVLLLKIFCGAGIGHLNMSVERNRYLVTENEKKVESLTMKINELTSFDNVKDLVKDMGLAYNNENIIIINK